jgi:prolyl 4-hydroxylase
MLHIDNRCPIDPDAVDTWSHAGHLTKTFERIVTDPAFEQYEPTILSQPPEGPWMIQMENFLSDEEAERLIELGYQQSYERSADVGKKQADGTYSQKVNGGRTSKNAWCIKECYEDPMARLVSERIENVTGIPETNSENLQLLRYEEGEFYNTHNDFIPYQIDRQCGARILTFYMYLNDVEEGGGTNFPELGLTVTPKRGRVAIWPSVLEDNPSAIDDRTKHQALPVIKGVKFGANAWVHQRDYKGPNTHACT